VLVGGAAAAVFARHRVSLDDDHVVTATTRTSRDRAVPGWPRRSPASSPNPGRTIWTMST
jgi:hypothetical protein